jgi:hypothetical protein
MHIHLSWRRHHHIEHTWTEMSRSIKSFVATKSQTSIAVSGISKHPVNRWFLSCKKMKLKWKKKKLIILSWDRFWNLLQWENLLWRHVSKCTNKACVQWSTSNFSKPCQTKICNLYKILVWSTSHKNTSEAIIGIQEDCEPFRGSFCLSKCLLIWHHGGYIQVQYAHGCIQGLWPSPKLLVP